MGVPILIGVDIGTARVKALGLGLDGSELAQVEHADAVDAQRQPGRDGSRRARGPAPGDRRRHPRRDRARRSRGHRGRRHRHRGDGRGGRADRCARPPARAHPRLARSARRRRRGAPRDRRGLAFQRAVGMRLNAQPSLAKILWSQRASATQHLPCASSPCRSGASICLGGLPVSELSLASRTGLLDIGATGAVRGRRRTARPGSAVRDRDRRNCGREWRTETPCRRASAGPC